MSVAHVVVTVLAALFAGYSGYAVLTKAAWVVTALKEYRVPASWWPWLGVAKVAGATGMLVGLLLPPLGVLAGACLVLYFLGAALTVARAKVYAHIPYPLVYLVPVAAALVLGQLA
ncbi:DoxX family protein [Kitasatospora sp. LaBMicrA B282]|uniref:DoxX family protein n=1 Tax=Kitasatospora sp. LaBMicrA B282 TaxID=3420949 RepID=UPI003D0F3349